MSAKPEQLKRRKRFTWRKQDFELTLLAIPTTIWYILFCYLPMFGIIIAFKQFKISGGFISNVVNSPWVGFKNFEFLFKSNDAWIIIRNTIGYNIIFIITGIVLPVLFAIMIGLLHNRKASKVYQTMMFLPYFLSWVVISAVGWAFFSFDKGILNQFLGNIGHDPVNWYMQPEYWPYILVLLNIWKGIGYGMIIYLATITAIDSSYYEAAVIDGASIWQQTRFITLPLLKLVIVMMFILSVGRIFYTDFGLFFQVTRDSNSLYNVATTVDVLVYKQLKSATIGMASAAAFVQSVLGCITILSANWIVKKVDPDSAMI
ncbi:ABC transporter permease [Paenibacillus sp. B2(2019)]|uniref:ABC transporter permease n=1 Tax=Paenibacillus sp. B2(2019) TaxID=2607754 RepID=UPI0011F2AB84|nr:ABC transporter permease subunit [Paenibacillus sp. B2(2019)]KAA1185053.1 sugar ABC transporter permease [Paenibacillus sp. B2(2019)]